MADRARLRQVVQSVLSDATRRSPENSVTSVTCAADAGAFHVSAASTFSGPISTDVESVFDLFFRATDLAAGSASETGPGLRTSREIVTRHSGQMSGRLSGHVLTVDVALPPDCVARASTLLAELPA